MIRHVFGEDVVTLPVVPDGNVVCFAFRDGPPAIHFERLVTVAFELRRTLGLDFPRYVRRLSPDWRRLTTP
jgi:hypothetical protein